MYGSGSYTKRVILQIQLLTISRRTIMSCLLNHKVYSPTLLSLGMMGMPRFPSWPNSGVLFTLVPILLSDNPLPSSFSQSLASPLCTSPLQDRVLFWVIHECGFHKVFLYREALYREVVFTLLPILWTERTQFAPALTRSWPGGRIHMRVGHSPNSSWLSQITLVAGEKTPKFYLRSSCWCWR